MTALFHGKSNTIGDFTGTVTVLNSQGSTATAAATDLVRPSDWNSGHNLFVTATGNTAGQSTASGTNLAYGGSNGITASLSTAAGAATLWLADTPPSTGMWWQPEVYGGTLTSALANGSLYLRPFELDGYYHLNRYLLQNSLASSASTMSVSASVSAGSASSGSGSWGLTGTVLLMSRVGTNLTNASFNSIQSFDSRTFSLSAGYGLSASWSTNASSATASWSTSGAVGFIKSIDNTGGFTTTATTSSGSSTFSSTSTNANSFSSSYVMSFPYAHLSGVRPLFVPAAGSVVAPGEYWLGYLQSTNTGSTNYPLQRVAMASNPGMLYFTASTNPYAEVGNSIALATSNWRPGFGSYSASSNTTAVIPLSQVSTMVSNASLYFALDGRIQ